MDVGLKAEVVRRSTGCQGCGTLLVAGRGAVSVSGKRRHGMACNQVCRDRALHRLSLGARKCPVCGLPAEAGFGEFGCEQCGWGETLEENHGP